MSKWRSIPRPRRNLRRLPIQSRPLLPRRHPPITTMATRAKTRKRPQPMRERSGPWHRRRIMPPLWETDGGSGTTVDSSIVAVIAIAIYPRGSSNSCRTLSHHRGAASDQNKSAVQTSGGHLRSVHLVELAATRRHRQGCRSKGGRGIVIQGGDCGFGQ